MPTYALKDTHNNIIRYQEFETPPILAASKGVTWVLESPVVHQPTIEDIKSRLIVTVQNHLDNTARARGYDSIVSACSYAAVANIFQIEGIAAIQWRSSVWEKCYQILAEVQANTRAIPSESELIALLPVINWTGV